MRRVLFMICALLAGWPAAGPVASASAVPAHVTSAAQNCGAAMPAATDGRFTLDRTSIPAGSTAVGILSNFAQWPQRLIGGGSGETFMRCLPWGPHPEQAVVAVHDSVGYFGFDVPGSVAAGTYKVSVIFYQGSTDPMSGGTAVRLTTSLTVAAAAPGASNACRLNHAAAAAGHVQAPASAHPSDTIQVSVQGATSSWLDEVSRLTYIACFAGQSTIVARPTSPTASFAVHIPGTVAPGNYTIRVTGRTGSKPVVWSHSIAIVAFPPPPPPTSSTVAPPTTSAAPTTVSSTPTSTTPTSTTTAPSTTTPAPSSTAAPSSLSASPAAGSKSGSSATPWILLGIGILVLGTGGFFGWRRLHHT